MDRRRAQSSERDNNKKKKQKHSVADPRDAWQILQRLREQEDRHLYR